MEVHTVQAAIVDGLHRLHGGGQALGAIAEVHETVARLVMRQMIDGGGLDDHVVDVAEGREDAHQIHFTHRLLDLEGVSKA